MPLAFVRGAGRLACAGAAFAGALLATDAASAAVARAGQPVMGTVLTVTVFAADEATARALADAAIAEARHWDDVLTTWRPEGELARLNARAGQGASPIGSDLAAALGAMQRMAASTGGAFDPAVGSLASLWRTPAPSGETLALRGTQKPRRIGECLILGDGTAELAAGSALDAGGIGKGIALDAIAELLRARKAEAAFLDFGGSSQLAIGAPPGADGWRVVVSGLEPGSVAGTMLLRDASLSTSRALGAGADAGPIIDAATGRPVEPPRLVTVRTTDATRADAWSTALVVSGPPGIPGALDAGMQVMIEDGNGRVTTAGFVLAPWLGGDAPGAAP